MLRIMSMALALIAVFVVSCAAEIIPFNGQTTTEIMNRLPILFTPASYVPIILVFIYLLLGIWLYKFWLNRGQISQSILNLRTVLFILSTAFHILWVLLWHYEFFHWTLLTIVLLLATLAGLYFSYPKTENRFFERVPISIYFAWVITSFISMVNYVLTLHEWSGFGISYALWTVIYLTTLTAIALHFMYHHQDIAFNLVFMWVFIGIAVSNGLDSLFVATAAFFLTAVIGASFFLMKNRRKPESIS